MHGNLPYIRKVHKKVAKHGDNITRFCGIFGVVFIFRQLRNDQDRF